MARTANPSSHLNPFPFGHVEEAVSRVEQTDESSREE